MKVIRQLEVPTGTILVVQSSRGLLECLSLGDYGRAHNVKADFLGHTKLLPLEEKWVITISSQYGCSMGCTFCDVPRVGPGINASQVDLLGQVEAAMKLHPEVSKGRINLHFARMGEPTWNPNVLFATTKLRNSLQGFRFHPVVSTMMPRKNYDLEEFLHRWMRMKAEADGDAGLQISVNSTHEAKRAKMFHGNALSLPDISQILSKLPVVGRKVALNFAVADYQIDAKILRSLFDPSKFMIKLTPMHRTQACEVNDIRTRGNSLTLAPYLEHERALKAEGFDVLVFVASAEEDKSRITCGNAILAQED